MERERVRDSSEMNDGHLSYIYKLSKKNPVACAMLKMVMMRKDKKTSSNIF
jgi:hypothetical protein